jgi:predicted N-acyltransferase
VLKNESFDYVTRVLASPLEVNASQWDRLLSTQGQPSPFMAHAYLAALHTSGSAVPATGWTPSFMTLWLGEQLVAACPLYLKAHSYGEYVFDWAWANAYAQHGLAYYPKALVAVPFTPVPGTRLMATNAAARDALVQALIAWCRAEKLSSLHLLFGAAEDLAACERAGMMRRDTVQFHWTNRAPTLATSCASLPPEGAPFALGRPGGESVSSRTFGSFDHFLASLNQEKRKKIRQERRKVSEAGVSFRWARGRDISAADWDFFYRCYERTYLEHGNAPYLSRAFFECMARDMPENWLLFVGERAGQPMASSLIALHETSTPGSGQNHSKYSLETADFTLHAATNPESVAYGRYWGALERVDCLHFEACYYQPLQWCIEHGIGRFEGGAQGEHKMARALLPVKASSAHWLAHPGFADAVQRFLEREGHGIGDYLEHLDARSPLRKPVDA